MSHQNLLNTFLF